MCVGSSAILGNRKICPNEVGLYQCTINGVDLRWMVNKTDAFFPGTHEVGFATINNIPNAIIFLTERIITNETTYNGTRISVMQYTPPPDYTGYINMTCSGGNNASECSNCIYAVGGKCTCYYTNS